MRESLTTARTPFLSSVAGRNGVRAAVLVPVVLAATVLLPVLPFFLGALLMATAGIHAWVPALRPGVQVLLRVPVAAREKRRAHLLLVAGTGFLLAAGGAVGASIRGQLRTEWDQHATLREQTEVRVGEVVERARRHIAAGELGVAELELMNAEGEADLAPQAGAELDALLADLRLSGDAETILEILTRLTDDEFRALETGASVPGPLDLGEPAMTERAVGIALTQLDVARQMRARP
jgi:hypothetical protein